MDGISNVDLMSGGSHYRSLSYSAAEGGRGREGGRGGEPRSLA